MSVVKRATINLFSTDGQSVGAASLWLQNYANSVVPTLAKKGLEEIASMAKAAAAAEYGGAGVNMDSRVENNTATVIASGSQVAFWEFGTGTYADPGANELSAGTHALGFDVYPGSWSYGPEGKWRYKDVEEKRVPMDKWPYAKYPRPGLLAAYNAIKQQYALLMQGAFKE